jgi:repressor LexA
VARPNNDRQHLQTLRDYFAAHRVLPSYSELGGVLGFSSKAGAFKLAQRLVQTGYLQAAAGGRLAPADRFFELPVRDDMLGAGSIDFDSWSGGLDAHELDRLLVDHPSRTVLVNIRGNSMVEAGVLDGDTAVVELSENASSGDFVAAIVDGQCTIKELRFERRKPVLVPHNKNQQIIRSRQDFRILGVVKGIIRRYRRPEAAGRARGAQA